jgi:ADP-heptose:LPS heptosyltransferase
MNNKLRLNTSGILVKDDRLKSFSVSAANINPPQRIQQIQNLINTKHPSICVLRGEGIGDVIMTTPTVNALYKKFNGNISITYATNTHYLKGALVKTLQGNKQIEHIIDRENLKEENFDAVINLHCPAIAHEKPMAPPINRIDLFARHAGFYPLEDTKPKFFLTEEEIVNAGYYLDSLKINILKPTILVNLFSSATSRSINNQTLVETVKGLSDLGYNILLTTHSDSDQGSASHFQDISGVRFVKDQDVRQLAALLKHVDVLLCPDSALLHVAGALDIPTIALFGPTDPRARVNYYPTATAIWGGEGLNGHPHWYEACPFHNICWKNITSKSIIEAVLNKKKEPEKKVDGNFDISTFIL